MLWGWKHEAGRGESIIASSDRASGNDGNDAEKNAAVHPLGTDCIFAALHKSAEIGHPWHPPLPVSLESHSNRFRRKLTGTEQREAAN